MATFPQLRELGDQLRALPRHPDAIFMPWEKYDGKADGMDRPGLIRRSLTGGWTLSVAQEPHEQPWWDWGGKEGTLLCFSIYASTRSGAFFSNCPAGTVEQAQEEADRLLIEISGAVLVDG